MSYRVAAGAEAFPVNLMSQVIQAAATDIAQSTGAGGNYAGQEKPINQQLYKATFDKLLHQLSDVSNSTINQGFAEALYFTMLQATDSGNLSPDLVPSLTVLAPTAGFDNAIALGFRLVCSMACPPH